MRQCGASARQVLGSWPGRLATRVALFVVLLGLYGETNALVKRLHPVAVLIVVLAAALCATALYAHFRSHRSCASIYRPLRMRSLAGSGGLILRALPWLVLSIGLFGMLCRSLTSHSASPSPALVEWINGSGQDMIVPVVWIVVVAPIIEEILFRGILLSAFEEVLGLWPSVLISTVGFVVAHSDPAAYPQLAFIGAVFAIVVVSANSLWAGVLLHAVNNAIVTLVILTGGQPGGASNDHPDVQTVVVLLLPVAWMAWRSMRRLAIASRSISNAGPEIGFQ